MTLHGFDGTFQFAHGGLRLQHQPRKIFALFAQGIANCRQIRAREVQVGSDHTQIVQGNLQFIH